jgi:hypothetical protein
MCALRVLLVLPVLLRELCRCRDCGVCGAHAQSPGAAISHRST